jgi:hypothetical protein
VLTDYARDSVRRLRMLGPPGDALSTRRSMERTLAGVDLTPRGLPPGAIVCLRRLRAERGPDDAGGWAQGIQTQIAGMVARGARPFRDAVPADAAAVIFEDEAELLACLARDWREGRGTTWWWMGLLGQPPSADLVRRVFLENPGFVPAAIEILLEAGRAIEFIRALPDDVCSELQRSVASAFDVSMGPARSPTESDSGVNSAAISTTTTPSRFVDRAVACVSVLGDMSVLSGAQRQFLAVGLLIRRAPVLARTPGVVWAVQALGSSGSFGGRIEPESTNDRSRPSAAGIDRVQAEANVESVTSAASHSTVESIDQPAAEEVDEMDSVEPQSAEESQPPVARARVAESYPPVAPVDESPDTDPSPEPFVTLFAGVFYLVNLAIELGAYSDFTQPARTNPEVPLGCFLRRTAERVCGEAFREDPIWPALAFLAEEDDLPIADDTSRVDRTIDDLGADLEHLAARGLDVEEGAALPFLCRTPGRVRIGRTRIDVFFSLAAHPIAIRIAGFDRNPGWVPAAGRVITFHYD